jgi:hypothetical protein
MWLCCEIKVAGNKNQCQITVIRRRERERGAYIQYPCYPQNLLTVQNAIKILHSAFPHGLQHLQHDFVESGLAIHADGDPVPMFRRQDVLQQRGLPASQVPCEECYWYDPVDEGPGCHVQNWIERNKTRPEVDDIEMYSEVCLRSRGRFGFYGNQIRRRIIEIHC